MGFLSYWNCLWYVLSSLPRWILTLVTLIVTSSHLTHVWITDTGPQRSVGPSPLPCTNSCWILVLCAMWVRIYQDPENILSRCFTASNFFGMCSINTTSSFTKIDIYFIFATNYFYARRLGQELMIYWVWRRIIGEVVQYRKWWRNQKQ